MTFKRLWSGDFIGEYFATKFLPTVVGIDKVVK
jgi:hypothetical protein